MVHVGWSSPFSWVPLINNSLIEPLAKLSCVQEGIRPGALTKEQMPISEKNVSVVAHEEILLVNDNVFPRHAEVRCIKSRLYYCQLRELKSHDNIWQAAGHMGRSRLPFPQKGAWFCAAESGIHTRKAGGAQLSCAVWWLLSHLSAHLQGDQAPFEQGAA